jgi:hypothetical protein
MARGVRARGTGNDGDGPARSQPRPPILCQDEWSEAIAGSRCGSSVAPGAIQRLLGRLRSSQRQRAVRYRLAAERLVIAPEEIQDDRDRALKWLRRAIDYGFSDLALSTLAPAMAGLRDDSEYLQIMGDLEARVEEMRARAAGR